MATRSYTAFAKVPGMITSYSLDCSRRTTDYWGACRYAWPGPSSTSSSRCERKRCWLSSPHYPMIDPPDGIQRNEISLRTLHGDRSKAWRTQGPPLLYTHCLA